MNLDEIEARLKSIIEDKLAGALSGRSAEEALFQKLIAAINEKAGKNQNGVKLAPNSYTITVPPTALNRWQDPRLLETFVEAIEAIGKDADLTFESRPSIIVNADAALPSDQFNVTASHQVKNTMENTQNTPAESEDTTAEDNAIPENAFLIIDGVKVFPLRTPVVNIGRRLDNTLVIDDPRVSRNHSQLRAIKGRYVIFDLNSTGGTFINGQRTSQSVLYPGDVVSLAGVAIIFGQDNPPPRPDLAITAPLDSVGGDRPTVALHINPFEKKKKKE